MTAGTGHRTLSRGQRQDLRNWLEVRGDDHATGAGYQASIHLYRGSAGEFIIKRALGSGLRKRLGQAAIRREARIYRRLQGVPGIPECFGRLNDSCLVLEYVPGGSLRKLDDQLEDRQQFFSKLLRTLRGMHEAGVAHGDLKKKDNILVGPGQEPFVIDFGIAVVEKGRKGFVFNTVKQVDYNAWTKHKYRGRMSEIAAEDAPLYRPMRLERAARVLRVLWRPSTLRKWRQRAADKRGVE